MDELNEVTIQPEEQNSYQEAKEKKSLRNRAIAALSSYLVINYLIVFLIQVLIIVLLTLIYPNLIAEYKTLTEQLEAIKSTGTPEEIQAATDAINNCLFYIKTLAWTNILASTILFATSIIIYFKELKREMKDALNRPAETFLTGFIGFFILIGGTIITNIIVQMIAGPGDSTNQLAIENICKNGYLLPMFFLTVIFAPIAEELIFRKAFFTLIENKWIALAASSLIFGAIHVIGGGDFVYLISYATSGLILGGIYIFSKKNIYASILTHMLNNGFSFMMIIVSMLLPQIA